MVWDGFNKPNLFPLGVVGGYSSRARRFGKISARNIEILSCKEFQSANAFTLLDRLQQKLSLHELHAMIFSKSLWLRRYTKTVTPCYTSYKHTRYHWYSSHFTHTASQESQVPGNNVKKTSEFLGVGHREQLSVECTSQCIHWWRQGFLKIRELSSEMELPFATRAVMKNVWKPCPGQENHTGCGCIRLYDFHWFSSVSMMCAAVWSHLGVGQNMFSKKSGWLNKVSKSK